MDVKGIARGILDAAAIEGKALQPPASTQPAPVLFGPTEVTRRFSQREARRHLQAYGGTDAVDWVQDAAQLYMATASSAPYHLEKDGKRQRTPREEADNEKYPGGEVETGLWNLLQHPNPYVTWEDAVELLVLDLLMVGNAYWYKYRTDERGRPLAVYRLAPPLVQVKTGTRLIEKYEYHVPGVPEPLELDPEHVIHFKLPNPHDPIYGQGIIAAGPRVYDIELAQVETMAQYFEQGAKLSGVLQTERSVPDPLHRKIQRQFASLYSGYRNAYKVAVLERGMQFQPIANTAAEAQFVELTKLGRERVFQMFRIHAALVNGDAAKPGLLDEGQRYFDTKVMQPFLKKLSRRISDELTQAWDVDLVFDYKYHLPEKERLTNAMNFGGMPGVKVKEVREYLNLEPLGDERDDIVLNLPGITTEEGGIADNVHDPAGGRPASPQNTASFPGAGQRAPKGAAVVAKPDRAARNRLQKAVMSGDPAALETELASATNAAAPDPRVAELLADKFGIEEGKAYAADQVASVDVIASQLRPRLQGATFELERAVERAVMEGKAMTKAQRPALIEAVEREPNWDILRDRLEELMGPTYFRAFRSAGAHYTRFGLLPSDANYQKLRKALLARPNGPKSISRTLREQIARQVAEGVRRGYAPEQILDGVPGEEYPGVRARFQSWRDHQAETIALTEAHAAYNIAAIDGIEQAGLKARVLDGDGDPGCAAADGELWTIEEANERLLEHPRCRRTFVPEVTNAS